MREQSLLDRRRLALEERIQSWKRRAPEGIKEDTDTTEDVSDDHDTFPEDDPLPLPSTLADNEQIEVHKGLEKDLRVGQAYDALKELRMALALKLALFREQHLSVRGQRHTQRSKAAIDRVTDTVTVATVRYRVAHAALNALGGNTAESEFRQLRDEDITTSNVFQSNRPLGRGQESQISWIWRMQGTGLEARDDDWLEEG